jgi:hypothetical protein
MNSWWMSGLLCLSQAIAGQVVPRANVPIVGTVSGDAQLSSDPQHIKLVGPDARYTLLVNGRTGDGIIVDVSRMVQYHVADAKIVSVSRAGLVQALRDGKTRIDITLNNRKTHVEVEVTGTTVARGFHFENDLVPILSRFNCNTSGCHGNAEGQNGFKLSVFGFDPPADYTALTKEARGRRLLPSAPEASLLLLKASGQMPHGGGVRLRSDTLEYRTVRDWIAAGAPYGDPKASRVTTIRIEPRNRILEMNGEQQLRVMARTIDGPEFDITPLTKFQSNNDAIAAVDETGLVSAGVVPGEAAIMANYLGVVDTFRVSVPRSEPIPSYPKLAEANFIDPLVHARLKKLNILPSERADDAEFMRRVYLDVIGTLPTAAEARAFLADKRDDKRAKLVDTLLDRPEFADYWALLWSDILRVDRQALGPKRAYAFYRWVRDSMAHNKPLDRFARELIVAEGPIEEVAPANFYKVATKPGEAASSLSQIFLGIRIACAECHHHPYDRWSQTDFVGMTAFFTPLAVKKTERGESLEASGDPLSKHPRTGETVYAHALATRMPDKSVAGERREALAAWMTSPDNPWFARNLANRVWAHFLGRGLVEPIDDVRDTNPPTNPELLDGLAKELGQSKFDFKALIRTITASNTYQRSARPNATNKDDETNYSRALFRRIPAEVLLDMVSQTTAVPERFKGMPVGTRAIQLWDSKTPHYFLKLFGRPQRLSACECERMTEPGVSQVLHLMNSPEIQEKIAHDRGTVAKLVKSKTNDGELVDELYLTFLSRTPTAAERERAIASLGRGANRREGAEDLAWSFLNSVEFVFNR